LTSPL
jgi:hypothetical protein